MTIKCSPKNSLKGLDIIHNTATAHKSEVVTKYKGADTV